MAITIFAALGTAIMVGIRTANISGAVVEEKSIAEKLGRNQMEYVFSQDYLPPGGSYLTLVLVPDPDQAVGFDLLDTNYTLIAEAEALTTTEFSQAIVDDAISDGNIEKVVVTIRHHGEVVLTLETLRTNTLP